MAYEIDLTLRAHLITLLKRQCEKTELQSTMELRNAPYTSGSNTSKAEQQQKSHFMANYQINPTYYDEVSLGKFLESFLDTIIEDIYATTVKANKKGTTNNGTYLKEIVMTMEIDRVIFKFYNGLIN